MQTVTKWIGVVVLILGLASLVFGALLVVLAGSAQGEVINAIKNERFPVVQYDENSPQTGYLIPVEEKGIIDTAEEIMDTADAVKDARWKVGEGKTAMENMASQGWVNYLAFQGVLNSARANLANAGFIRLTGIVDIILGIALFLAGLGLRKLVRA